MFPLWPFLFAVLVLPALFALFFVHAVTLSFVRLGLSPGAALLFFVACLAGGFINVPVWREERREPEPPV
ncbi:MAG: hypothetical protein IRY95_09350, partial [Clostridia bacterium]|nr:hypothetical protein [Clostridia bacterium]